LPRCGSATDSSWSYRSCDPQRVVPPGGDRGNWLPAGLNGRRQCALWETQCLKMAQLPRSCIWWRGPASPRQADGTINSFSRSFNAPNWTWVQANRALCSMIRQSSICAARESTVAGGTRPNNRSSGPRPDAAPQMKGPERVIDHASMAYRENTSPSVLSP
jgi:hypothetical protein